MEKLSSSCSNSWQVISGNQDSPKVEPAPISEVMAGSFCREKQIANILEVKEDESYYLLRFKDGSEAWVASVELDETTKQFFKLSEPVKRALSFNGKEQIKIEHLETSTIYRISTSGINNVQQLKKRYGDNIGCIKTIDLYAKHKETGELMLIPPEAHLPLKSSKVFAKTSSSIKPVDTSSSLKRQHSPSISSVLSIVSLRSTDIPPLEEEEEKTESIASVKSVIAFENREMSTAEATSEVIGAVGGCGGNGLVEKIPLKEINNAPKIKMTESICAKMSDSQRVKLAMKMSAGTLTCEDLQNAMRETSNDQNQGPAVFLKNMFSSFTGIFGNNVEEAKMYAHDEPKADLSQVLAPPTDIASIIIDDDSKQSSIEIMNPSQVQSVKLSPKAPVSEAKVTDQEQKPVEEHSDVVYDLVIEAKPAEEDPKAESELPRPIIHSQPIFDNSRIGMSEWLKSLTEIRNKDQLITAVGAKVAEVETKHAIELSEIENKHKILITSLRDIIRRQSSEKSEISRIMKENKKALLTAIEEELNESSKKFEQSYEGYLQMKANQLEAIDRKFDQGQHVFDKIKQDKFVEKQDEPKAVKMNTGKLSVCPKEAPIFIDCPGGHGLRKTTCEYNDMVCDKCQIRIAQNTEIHTCLQCNFDVCDSCFRIQGKGSRKSEVIVKTEVLGRGVSVDLDRVGQDFKEKEAPEENNKISVSVNLDANDEETKDEAFIDGKEVPVGEHNLEGCLEVVNVVMSKGGLINMPMEVTVELKNVDSQPIDCLVSLTTNGDSSRLILTRFINSCQPEQKIIRINVSPGDVFKVVMELNVPHIFVAKKYNFIWQFTEYKSGQKLGPLFALENIQLFKPLEDAAKEEKVRRFCSLGLTARDEVIKVLEENGWNLNRAVNAFYVQ